MEDFIRELKCATIHHESTHYGNNVKLLFGNKDVVSVVIPNYLQRENISVASMNNIMDKLATAIIEEISR